MIIRDLFEAVDYAKHYYQIKDQTMQVVKGVLEEVPQAVLAELKGQVLDFEGDGSGWTKLRDAVEKTSRRLLIRDLSKLYSHIASQLLSPVTGKKVEIKFTKLDDHTGAQYHNFTIFFNMDTIDTRQYDITQTIMESLMNNYSGGDDLAEIISNYSAPGLDDFYVERFEMLSTQKLVSYFLHELVHARQDAMQQHRAEPEYRSYIDRKFTGHGDRDADWHRGYYSSPQEIAAFATQFVTEFLEDMYISSPEDLGYINSEYIHRGLVRKLNNVVSHIPDTTEGKKVKARYLKQMYQALMHIIDDWKNSGKNTNQS